MGFPWTLVYWNLVMESPSSFFFFPLRVSFPASSRTAFSHLVFVSWTTVYILRTMNRIMFFEFSAHLWAFVFIFIHPSEICSLGLTTQSLWRDMDMSLRPAGKYVTKRQRGNLSSCLLAMYLKCPSSTGSSSLAKHSSHSNFSRFSWKF